MSDFLMDGGWIGERSEEVSSTFGGYYDALADPILNMRYDGVFKIRFLPIRENRKDDWLRPTGYHWNLLPKTEDGPTLPLGCPQITYGHDCPICRAIGKLYMEKKVPANTFGGMEGIQVQRKYLSRVLLLGFADLPTTKKAPDWSSLQEEPLVKIFQFPYSIAKELQEKLNDRDFGFNALLHPKKGKEIKVTRSEKKQGYWSVDFLDPWEIPDEYLETGSWLEFEDFLPKEDTEQIEAALEKYQKFIDPRIINAAFSVDVRLTGKTVEQIEEETSEKKTEGKPDKKGLKEKLLSL